MLAVVRGGNVGILPPAASVGLLHRFAPELRTAGLTLLGTITGLGTGLAIFFVALIVAGIMMAHGEKGHVSALRMPRAFPGPILGRGSPHSVLRRFALSRRASSE